VVREPGKVLVVPVDRLRELVAQDPALAPVLRDQGPDRPAGHGKADHCP
jgi:hypothetical protein